MKLNILLLIFSLLFISCSDSPNKFKIDSFNKGSKLVCYNKQSTGSGRLANAKHVDAYS